MYFLLQSGHNLFNVLFQNIKEHFLSSFHSQELSCHKFCYMLYINGSTFSLYSSQVFHLVFLLIDITKALKNIRLITILDKNIDIYSYK